MAAISLRLIGPFEARSRDGTAIPIPGRRSAALLACMADDAAGPWSRERLAALLWAGRGSSQARNSLRQELVRLRSALTGPIGERPHLWNGTEGLVLPPEIFDVDLRQLLAAAKDPRRVSEAAQLYRGELLQDFHADDTPFGTWLADRRLRLRQATIGCMLRALNDADPLAAPSEARQGDAEKCGLAQRLLELEPGSEEAHRWLIGFYRRRGEAAKAHEQFRVCEEILRLAGAMPSAATLGLISGLTVPRPFAARPSAQTDDGADWIAWVRQQAAAPLAPSPRRLSPVDNHPSLVVLPFADLAAAEDPNTVLAPGLTEEVTDALARVPGFFVAARHSAMSYAGAADVRRVAAELGVRYLIEGSALHDGQWLRVTLRLIDGGSGTCLWSDSDARPLPRLMELRDSVVLEIVGRLQPELHAAEVRRALERPVPNLDAWGWLQRAHCALDSKTREEQLSQALPPLDRALEIDPGYGMAHALISAVRTWRSNARMFPDPDEDRRLARIHADTALGCEPSNPYVLAHCADTLLYSSGDIDGANALLDQATRRNPCDPSVLAMTGNARRFAGDDPARSLSLIEQAKRLSPRDRRTFSWEHYANWCHWRLGDYAAMEAAARRSIELYSGFAWSWVSLVCALGLQQRWPEAARAAREMLDIIPQFSPAAFFETARVFYGRRFPGTIEADYTQLRDILEKALGLIRSKSVVTLRPRRHAGSDFRPGR